MITIFIKESILMSGKKKVAVIFGGMSFEHEVSRFSAKSVLDNMDKEKYDITVIGITKDGRWLKYDGPTALIASGEWLRLAEESGKASIQLPERASVTATEIIPKGPSINGRFDVVFPILHGINGEDGTVQGFLELTGIPYVGCGVLSSALAMDKGYAKKVLEMEGIPQAAYLIINKKEYEKDSVKTIEMIEQKFGYPCFVKPCNAGSSVGVTKAHDRNELIQALEVASRYDRRILVEEFIDGREVECAVLGNDDPIASTVGEIIPCNEFYDYHAKYSDESTSEIRIPADLPQETIEKVRSLAVKAFKALDCSGLSRIDFFVRRDTGEVILNEINTMPGFTKISMYPKLWEASGIPYSELIDRLIELAIERYNNNTKALEL